MLERPFEESFLQAREYLDLLVNSGRKAYPLYIIGAINVRVNKLEDKIPVL